MRVLTAIGFVFVLATATSGQQGAQPTPTDRTKASQFTAAELAAAIAKVPADRPVTSTRIFTLAPYAVNVERRQPLPQGASVHEAQAELFYVIDGSATLLTGGKLIDGTRNGTNLSGKGIEGGTRNQFNKGDFLVVPSGVPHQLVDIKAPVTLMSLYLPNTTNTQ
jgi:mannose-6-phosphate isomerase-like protein (cupin superfamily)